MTHQDVKVRTTITLEPDVERLLKAAMHRERKSLKAAVNDALRRALAPAATRDRGAPYQVVPHDARLQPGYDRAGFNKLVDELEDEAVVAQPGPTRR